jgi:BlaI family transcriptional regulator, penicillinase repressor
VPAVKDMPTPTARELEILKVLWEHGASSVRDVHRRLAADDVLAYNTVQTLLRIMEDKQLVTHHVEGRTFVYTPRYSRDESAARFLDRVFDGAVGELVQSLLRNERISREELGRLQSMIAAARRRKASRRSGDATGEEP